MKKLSRVKIKDIFSIFIFILMLPLSFFYKGYLKLTKRKLVLICEDPNEAVDNGYELYKYLRNVKNKSNVFYAISNHSPHLYKFKGDPNRITFYSIKHWIYYMSASINVSNHKASSPSPALFYILQKYKIFNGNRIFLQHGITMNYVDYLSDKECNFKYFVTAAIPEHNFILKELGYTNMKLRNLGFSRFDSLYNSYTVKNNNKIAILPTWRNYLFNSNETDFKNSRYFIEWQNLLLNPKLSEYLERNNIILYFYLHRNFQKFSGLYHSCSKNIIIAKVGEYDLNSIIRNTNMIITDYSSISIDYAYLNKPVIYFQFDSKEFQKHLKPGYFSYTNDGFGNVHEDVDNVVSDVLFKLENDLMNEEIYSERINEFFKYRDNNNSERISKLIYD